FSILSGRDTLNRSGRSTYNTANTALNKAQLGDIVGYRMTGAGPMFISSSAINTDGRGVAADGAAQFNGQVFFNPPPGTIGSLQRRDFSGPWVSNMDFALIKKTKITERQSVELRMDAQNIFNHPTFTILDQALN